MKHSADKNENKIRRKNLALRKKRIRSLEKEKLKSLGILEILSLKYAGWQDGRKGLIRQSEEGVWQSSRLKGETDSYEEFCGKLYGRLKLEEEEEFRSVNVLFNRAGTQYKALEEAKERLNAALGGKTALAERRAGEEELTEAQIIARRSRERSRQLEHCYRSVSEKEKILFAGDQSVYLSPDEAEETLRPIAEYLQQHETVNLLLVGGTAGDETNEATLQLSQERADRVKSTLTELGISGERLKTLGMGAGEPWHISGAGTNGKLASENRKVVLLDMNSQQAKEILNQ